MLHVDSHTPLDDDGGRRITDEPWGIYVKPDRESIQGGAAPIRLGHTFQVDPYPTGTVDDGFPDMWCAALSHCLGRFEGSRPLYRQVRSGGAGAFTADNFPVFDRMRDNVYVELQNTIHFTNRSGVRATCPDCHVPHEWTSKIARKMQASKEVWGKIFGSIDTREKFEAMRLTLAQHEWDRLKANNSLECRNCHDFDYMDFTRQSKRAAGAHSTYLADGSRTCIDCHKGIAHRLPNMGGVAAR